MSAPFRYPGRPLALAIALAAALSAPSTASDRQGNAEAELLLRGIRGATLAADGARSARNLVLDTGYARLHLRSGTLFPVLTPEGRMTELVFVGDGVLDVAPPDDIEAGQLDLFTGSPRLEVPFDEAVLIVGLDSAAEKLLRSPEPTQGNGHSAATPARSLDRAQRRLDAWRGSPERRLAKADPGLLLDALGDPAWNGHFVAWCRTPRFGDVLLAVDPRGAEGLTLGRRVPIEADRRERRKILRQLERQQRRGRLLGLELDDLGVWDTWMSTPLRDGTGEPVPGVAAFEPDHYALDVRLDPRSNGLEGNARLELEGTGDGGRAARLSLHGDLEVTAVRTGDGDGLPFLRDGAELWVLLPEPSVAGQPLTVAVDYRGRFLDPGGLRNWALRDNLGWHPHAGLADRATYDVTLRWPEGFDLLAAGKEVESGTDGEGLWRRHRLDRPTWGFGFAVGEFDIERRRIPRPGGDAIDLTVAFDPEIRDSGVALREITATVASSLLFFEDTFGPYPLDALTAVTVPADYSQSLLGFVTLSNLLMLGQGFVGDLLGLEDRRTVVAHEVAHQWWGHRVGWASYRDQWISEAMANYSALLWARHGSAAGDPSLLVAGPTEGWQDRLTQRLPDGRALESVGPMVLGHRLHSSLTDDAYEAIVYRKGAVVLDMLARRWPPGEFQRVLRAVVELADGGVLSTEDFFALLERAAGEPFDAFARSFVYGTGLPEVYYDYAFEALPEGRYGVRIRARQDSPYRQLHRVEAIPGGGFDVARRRLDQIDVGGSRLVVPVQIELVRPDDPTGALRIIHGRFAVDGADTEVEFEIAPEPPWRPRGLRLDGAEVVFGRFFDRLRFPKRVLYYRGLDLAAAGRRGEARDHFGRALAARIPLAEDTGRGQRRFSAELERILDGRILQELARLDLDDGRLGEAGRRLEEAMDAVRRGDRWALRDTQDLLRSRLEILSGEPRRALRRLRRRVEGDGEQAGPEAWLLLAISAQATGDGDLLRRAVDRAEGLGADASLLHPEGGVGGDGNGDDPSG
ncbi:MAG: M1 family aminopeptidase [Acidobacteriota bacterium]